MEANASIIGHDDLHLSLRFFSCDDLNMLRDATSLVCRRIGHSTHEMNTKARKTLIVKQIAKHISVDRKDKAKLSTLNAIQYRNHSDQTNHKAHLSGS